MKKFAARLFFTIVDVLAGNRPQQLSKPKSSQTRHRKSTNLLNFETLESRNMMAPITYGMVHSDQLETPTTTDTHLFYAPANTRVQLGIGSHTGGGFAPRMEVFRPDGTRILNMVAEGTTRVTPLTLPEFSGFYQIKVTDQYRRHAGTYSVGLERLNLPSGDAQPIARGGFVQGQINGLLDVDQYTFYAREGERLDLAIYAAQTQSFSARADVYNPSGQRIATLGMGGLARQQFRDIGVGQSGVYKVLLYDSGYESMGDYYFGLEIVSPSSNDSLPFSRGEVKFGTISSTMERDQFRFWLPAGAPIQIALEGIPSQANFVASAELFSPTGQRVARLIGNAPRQTELSVEESGFYTLQLSDDDRRETGSYRIGIEGLNPISLDATPLTKGGIISGAITNPIEKRQFFFHAGANQKYRLTLESTPQMAGFHAVAKVYSPSGQYLRSISGNQRFTDIDAIHAGRYMVQIEDSGLGQLGTFSVGLEGIKPASPNATLLPYNSTLNRNMTHDLEHQQFRFWRYSNTSFSLDVRGGASSPGRGGIPDGVFSVKYEVFDPFGISLGRFSANTINQFTAQHDGVYLVMVSDNNFDAQGSFSIRRF